MPASYTPPFPTAPEPSVLTQGERELVTELVGLFAKPDEGMAPGYFADGPTHDEFVAGLKDG